ncbi:hypothetical protein TYRP_017295 [Tyrophagus putrescentiae]|nr:hypothetical protein TYRP_017295 [Tyrophagus putrescentiae]
MVGIAGTDEGGKGIKLLSKPKEAVKEAEGEVLGSVLHTGPPTPPPAEMAAAATPVLVAGTEGAAREGTDTRTSSMAAAETAVDFFEDSKGLEVFEVFEVLLNDIADTAI